MVTIARNSHHGLLEEHGLLLAVAEMRRQFDEAVRNHLFGQVDSRDACFAVQYSTEDLRVRDVAVTFVDHVEPPGEPRFASSFHVDRLAAERIHVVWHAPAQMRCSHHTAREPRTIKRLTECPDHLFDYASEGFAKLLENVIAARFPDEKFRFYRCREDSG